MTNTGIKMRDAKIALLEAELARVTERNAALERALKTAANQEAEMHNRLDRLTAMYGSLREQVDLLMRRIGLPTE